jgi:hypothetical protein
LERERERSRSREREAATALTQEMRRRRLRLLTTKFGNISIGDEDGIEAESKMRIVAETE